MICVLDTETRARRSITLGLPLYFACQQFRILALSYAILRAANDADSPVQAWRNYPQLTDPEPVDLLDHIERGGLVAAHNAEFELRAWERHRHAFPHWPMLRPSQVIDTRALCAAAGLPQSLAQAAKALDFKEEQQKSARGRYLITECCVAPFNDDFDLLEELTEYCRQDIVVTRALLARLPPLRPRQQREWERTYRINCRGVRVDRDLATVLASLVELRERELNRECEALTSASAGQVGVLREWINARLPEPVPDLSAATLRDLLAREDLSEEVRRAVELRLHAAKASTKKFIRMLDLSVENGRLEGMLVWHGAGPGRYTSQGGLNLQNLPRGKVKPEKVISAIRDVVDAAERGSNARLIDVYGEPLDCYASLVRPCLIPSNGKMFVDADYSSIENRVAAWVSGDERTLDKFRSGFDQYIDFATEMYRVPADQVTAAQRQVAKSAVLGCIYGQGWRGYINYAALFGVRLTKEEAKEVVSTFRRFYARVKYMWRRMGDTSVEAVRNPGQVVHVNQFLRFQYDRSYDSLYLRLPSGRRIAFFKPRVRISHRRRPVADPDAEWEVCTLADQGPEYEVFTSESVEALGINTKTRRWGRNDLGGYKLFQNAVQGIAYDFLANGMRNVENDGYDIVLTVHDEVLAEHKNPDLDAFLAAFTHLPAWAPGFPLSASGWVGTRYRK